MGDVRFTAIINGLGLVIFCILALSCELTTSENPPKTCFLIAFSCGFLLSMMTCIFICCRLILISFLEALSVLRCLTIFFYSLL